MARKEVVTLDMSMDNTKRILRMSRIRIFVTKTWVLTEQNFQERLNFLTPRSFSSVPFYLTEEREKEIGKKKIRPPAAQKPQSTFERHKQEF